MTPGEAVKEFHRVFEIPILTSPQFPAQDRIDLRVRLIDEERQELAEALEERNVIEVADALGDIVYLCYGMANEFGIDLDAVFNEIHRSNMTKLGEDGKPVRREDNKILKGPNYEPPNIGAVLAGQVELPTDMELTIEFVKRNHNVPQNDDVVYYKQTKLRYKYQYTTAPNSRLWSVVT